MSRYALNVIPIRQLHYNLGTVLFPLSVDVLLPFFDAPVHFVRALDAVYCKCAFLRPNLDSHNLAVGGLAQNIPVCELLPLGGRLSLLIVFDVRLVCDGLGLVGLELSGRHLGLLLLLVLRLAFGQRVVGLQIDTLYFRFQLAYLLVQFADLFVFVVHF